MDTPDARIDETGFLHDGGETGALIARFDWAASPMGLIHGWPERLKAAIALMLPSPVPIMLLWGADGIMFYNDAHARLMGVRHPMSLGAPVRKVWPELAEFSDQILGGGLAGRTISLRSQEMLVDRSGQSEQAWFDVDCSPLRDGRGEAVGVLVISVETTQRVLAERKAARELARQREMFEQAPGFVCLLSGPDLIVEFTNAAHRRLFGVHDAEGRPYMEAYAEIAALGAPEILFQVYATGERYIGRADPVLIPQPNGEVEEHLLDLMLEPVKDDEGRVRGLFLEGFDVTGQVRAQRAVEESNRRLNAALSIARLGAFEWDGETGNMVLDSRAREIFGFSPQEPVTRDDVIARIDPDDFVRVEAEAAAKDAVGRTRRDYEFRIYLPDGSTRQVASVSDLSTGKDGRSRRFIGVFDDVTERRASERRQRMLINELNHRVKNTLATVQSIAAQTLRSADDVASARDEFESRLVALAAAHDLLTAQGWRGADLAEVVAMAMAPFESSHPPRITRAGPNVWLKAERALALSLALHELATNAAKYGALSVAAGMVEIRWRANGDAVKLIWAEQGGPAVTPRTRTGFGARLLQRSLARELGGEVDWIFRPQGVRCDVRCKLDQAGAATLLEVAESAGRKFNF